MPLVVLTIWQGSSCCNPEYWQDWENQMSATSMQWAHWAAAGNNKLLSWHRQHKQSRQDDCGGRPNKALVYSRAHHDAVMNAWRRKWERKLIQAFLTLNYLSTKASPSPTFQMFSIHTLVPLERIFMLYPGALWRQWLYQRLGLDHALNALKSLLGLFVWCRGKWGDNGLNLIIWVSRSVGSPEIVPTSTWINQMIPVNGDGKIINLLYRYNIFMRMINLLLHWRVGGIYEISTVYTSPSWVIR